MQLRAIFLSALFLLPGQSAADNIQQDKISAINSPAYLSKMETACEFYIAKQALLKARDICLKAAKAGAWHTPIALNNLEIEQLAIREAIYQWTDKEKYALENLCYHYLVYDQRWEARDACRKAADTGDWVSLGILRSLEAQYVFER